VSFLYGFLCVLIFRLYLSSRFPIACCFQQVDCTGTVIHAGDATACYVTKSESRPFDLAFAGLTAQVPEHLDGLRDSRCADWVTLGN
jgi:hypothetical protein